jgi:hypothetical protein
MESGDRVRHQNEEFFIPDLVVQKGDQNIVVADVQVSWLRVDRDQEEEKYGREKFIQAATKNWPGMGFEFASIILGARGIWPRVNNTLKTSSRLI